MILMKYLLGDETILKDMPQISPKEPFALEVLEFCQEVSKELLQTGQGKKYPDIVTLGFWLRKSSLEMLKKRFLIEDGGVRLGRGVIFHVAPSNVPVNFAYSLFSGMICGNANIVRVPSREFRQVSIIIKALGKAVNMYPTMAPYICLVRYGHEQDINDILSSICDVRVIWGGDVTIAQIRKSPLSPRATDVSFADRFSVAVIETGGYAKLCNREKGQLARNFYNDTYLTDQNACTSPKLVIWIDMPDNVNSNNIRKEFWSKLWEIVEREYAFQDIQGVNKLTKKYLLAVEEGENVKENYWVKEADNRLICVEVAKLKDNISLYFENSGYFLEYVTKDISDLIVLGKEKRCQTVGYFGDIEKILPLIKKGIKGIDRVVPIGKTMDFDWFWDGYNLYERFTRKVVVV